jgi:hypothetical protein
MEEGKILDILKTEKGLVAVNNSYIDKEDYIVHNNKIYKVTGRDTFHLIVYEKNVYVGSLDFIDCKKIIATDITFKVGKLPQFELEDELSFLNYQASYLKDHYKWSDKELQIALDFYKKGYQTKGYGEEDLRKAINFGATLEFGNISIDYTKYPNGEVEQLIETVIKPSKELSSIEIDYTHISGAYDPLDDDDIEFGDIDIITIVKSDQYPDGLLKVKKYNYGK